MNKIWRVAGRVAFILCLPALAIYLRIGSRTRVVVECQGKIVVTRGWLGDGKWCLPGGGLHRGENALVGAIREVAEETGIVLQAEDMQYLGTAVQQHGLMRFKYSMFAASKPELPDVRRQRFEILDVELMDPELLSLKNTTPESIRTMESWRRAR